MDKENKTKEMSDMHTVYELSYLLLPSLAVEQVPGVVATLNEIVKTAGGAVISDENPILIDLAYPMTKVVQTVRHKCTTGYFGWIKFELGHDAIEAVKKNLDMTDTVLRYLIIKTVRENTLIAGKMQLKKEDVFKKDESLEEATLSEEALPEVVDIDKTIDDLVA